MGLKRRNPARTRLFTAPEMVATLALARAPAANAPTQTAEAPIAKAAKTATPTAQGPGIARAITREQRHQLIARAAYGLAERAGFAIDPVQSWLRAEREIDAQLARKAS